MGVDRVSDSLRFPVNAYEAVVGWLAATNRLSALQRQAEEVVRAGLGIDMSQCISAENVSVTTPDGRCIVSGFSVCVERGGRILAVGSAMRGKSLLVRTLAGLWAHKKG